jgi:hypothetical protein
MNTLNYLTSFLNLNVIDIQNQLSTIGASLNLISKNTSNTSNTFMIKFSDDTQLKLQHSFQGFLKGLIFEKYVSNDINTNSFKILSVSYIVPMDVSLVPDQTYTYNIIESAKINPTTKYYSTKTGTLLKLSYYDNNWHLSTNGVHDAYINKLKNINSSSESFGEKFDKYFDKSNYDNLDVTYTYVFILTNNTLYHVCTINNTTLIELDLDVDINKLTYTGNNVNYFTKLSGDQFLKHMTNETYVLLFNDLSVSEGHTYRYLFPSTIQSTIINSILQGVPFTSDNTSHMELYNSWFTKINEMYNVVLSKYWNFVKKQKIVEPHIRSVVHKIHQTEFYNFLQPRGLKMNIKNIIHYFKTYSDVREINYIINDIKLSNTSLVVQ